MQVVDLTLTIEEGLQPHPAHPGTIVMDFSTRAGTAPRYKAPSKGFAPKLMGEEGLPCPIRAVAVAKW